MLKNIVYKGICVWNRKLKGKKVRIEVDVLLIVIVDLFDSVNKNLFNNKLKVGKCSEFNYLFNGLIICGYCGKEYWGKKRVMSKDFVYKCI